MKNKFNEGDIIIGNKGADVYKVHKEGTVWEVVEVIDNKWVYVSEVGKAEIIENAATSTLAYTVQSKRFDLFSEDSLLKEARRRYPKGTRVSNNNLGHFGAFTINSTKFHYEPNGNIVRYVGPSIGSYTIFENGKWADIIPTVKPVEDNPLKFKVGDKVEIAETSIYRHQGYNSKIKQKDSEKGLKMVGTILENGPSSLFDYIVRWSNNTENTYNECDLVPHVHVVVSKPKFNIGDYVMISPSSRFIDQGYRNGEKLIGKVSKVYGSDPIYYVVVWTDNTRRTYEGKDLEPYLHNDNPRHVIRTDFNSYKFESLKIKELEDPNIYKSIKKTTSLDFQEPVIVKKSTGRKFKLITIN